MFGIGPTLIDSKHRDLLEAAGLRGPGEPHIHHPPAQALAGGSGTRRCSADRRPWTSPLWTKCPNASG